MSVAAADRQEAESIERSNSPQVPVNDQFESLRLTPEYRVAWDLQVWKHVQQTRLEKDLKEQHRKAVDQMKATISMKDKEASIIIEKKIREVADELRKVQAEAASQEARKRKLVEAEKEMQRQTQALAAHKQRIEAEAEERIKLMKTESAHKLQLEAEKQKAQAQAIARQNEQLSAAHKEYSKLWEEFAEFKSKILREGGGGVLGGQVEALRAQHAAEIVAITERHERRIQEMVLQHEKKSDDLRVEIKKLDSALGHKREQLKSTTADLQIHRERCRDQAKEIDLLRQQLLARPEPKPRAQTEAADEADGTKALADSAERVAALLSSKHGADPHPGAKKGNRSGARHPHHDQHHTGSSSVAAHRLDGVVHSETEAEAELRRSVERWQAEKRRLLELSGGAYTEKSDVIVDLSRRILAGMEALRHVAAPIS